MPLNRNHLIVGALCLICALVGAFGGYSLKSRLVNTGKSDARSDLPVSSDQIAMDSSSINATTQHQPQRPMTSTSTVQGAQISSKSKVYKRDINKLVMSIHAVAKKQQIEVDLDELIKTELEFVELLDDSPALINPLLNVYQYFPDSGSKNFLRSLLVTTGSSEIERRGIDYLMSGELTNRGDWLALMRDYGARTTKARNELFNAMPMLNESSELRDAILAISPQTVSSMERQDVVNRLSGYLQHNDDLVRSAAVEALSKWADEGQSYIIEQALTDTSNRVRFTAISAAFSSAIRSDYIESILLDIMNDPGEDFQMRIHAHNALSNYSLQGQNYEQYYEFHQQLIANQNTSEAKG